MAESPEPDTDTLLEQASQGDDCAVASLFDRHRPRLRRLLRARMDDQLAARLDSSDVVQEAFVAALKRLPGYLQKRPLPFYPWLRQIALDRLVDQYRHHVQADKRSVTREQVLSLSDASAIQLAEHALACESGPATRLVRKELVRRARVALEQLQEKHREVLIPRQLEGLSTRETAEVLGVSESTVKVRHLRALRRLRQVLEDAD